MKTRKLFLLMAILSIAALLSACSQKTSEMQDGYYSAEMASYDAYGWKEFITIYVSDNNIVTVEYNAKNSSGFIKSWDMNYMRTMAAECGTYPNEYTRAYAVSLINWQDTAEVDAVSGATHSHITFRLLAEAAIAQAKAGDKQVALVEQPGNSSGSAEG